MSLGRLPTSSTQHPLLETAAKFIPWCSRMLRGRSLDQGARVCKLRRPPIAFSKQPDTGCIMFIIWS